MPVTRRNARLPLCNDDRSTDDERKRVPGMGIDAKEAVKMFPDERRLSLPHSGSVSASDPFKNFVSPGN
ncbi:hypothetical protein QE152_g17019 [Popillia japonica]|uniref:Uncharacterized protein n=1 Tax=Popillia japonica TaxID=7064 RepID=A0AAW1L5E9_POPJA